MSTKIVELNSTSIVQGTDIYPVSQVVNNKRETVKVTVSQLYSYLVTNGIATTTQLNALSAELTVKIDSLPKLPLDSDPLHTSIDDLVPVYDASSKSWKAKRYNNFILQYVNTNYVNVSGDTMEGSFYLKTDPHAPNEASNKRYVDAQVKGVADALNNYILAPQDAKDGDMLTYSSGSWMAKKPNYVAQVYTEHNVALTLESKHVNSVICFDSNLGEIRVSIPSESNEPTQVIDIGAQLMIMQKGTAAVTIQALSPSVTTLLSAGNRKKLTQQNSSAFLIKIAREVWYLGGDIWQ